MLSLTSHFDWDLEQMDVKTVFLHGYLDRKIYMAQLDGYYKTGGRVLWKDPWMTLNGLQDNGMNDLMSILWI